MGKKSPLPNLVWDLQPLVIVPQAETLHRPDLLYPIPLLDFYLQGAAHCPISFPWH